MRIPSVILTGLMLLSSAPVGAQLVRGAPETFSGTAQAKTAKASASAVIEIHLARYTPDYDRTAVENGLKQGGYRGFLAALKLAPDVGTVTLGEQTFTIRWARERTSPKGRTIVVVTDKPMYFIGGGGAKAEPRAGYEVGLIQLDVDENGAGSGTMAGAARVKPGGATGVQVDDFADIQIQIVGVTRKGS